MMSLLSQIILNFLAIVAGFIGAYFVYLYSIQSNIDQQMQLEGLKIISSFRNEGIYKIPSFIRLDSILENYKQTNPKKPEFEVLNDIARDLNRIVAWGDNDEISTDSRERLRAGQKGFSQQYSIGPIFVWLIKRYIAYLSITPPHSVIAHSIVHKDDFIDKSKLHLFPYGMSDVERWSNDTFEMMESLDFCFINKKIILDDLEKWIKQQNGNWKSYPYGDWFNNVQYIFNDLQDSNLKIKSQLRLKNSYSIETRLPHLKWIILIGILTFIMGVFVPLVINGMKREANIPSIVNIAILVITTVLLAVGLVLCGKDIVARPNAYQISDHLAPLKGQLEKYIKYEYAKYDLDVVNDILSQERVLNYTIKNLLEEYRSTAIEVNNCSLAMLKKLSLHLKESPIIRRDYENRAVFQGSGTKGVGLINLLNKTSRDAFYQTMKNHPEKFELSYTGPHWTRIAVELTPPEDLEQLNTVIEELDRILDQHAAAPEVKECLKKRQKLKAVAEKLYKEVKELVE